MLQEEYPCDNPEQTTGYHCALYELQDYLNTLEVKEGDLEKAEMDLEKELNDFIEQKKAWIRYNRVVEYYNGTSFNHIYDLEELAKHFFELGLKAQKGE